MDSLTKMIKTIRTSIESGKIEIAINNFKTCLKKHNNNGIGPEVFSLQNDLSLIYSNYKRANNNYLNNLATHEETNPNISKATKSLLSLLTDFEKLISNSDQDNFIEKTEEESPFSKVSKELGQVIIIEKNLDVEITIKKDFSDFTDHDLSKLLKFIAGLADIREKDLRDGYKGKFEGSVKLKFNLSAEKAKKLQTIFESGLLENNGITDLKVHDPQKTIKEIIPSNVTRLYKSDIIRIEGRGHACIITTQTYGELTIQKSLGEFMKLLRGNEFARVHRSHIINLSHLVYFKQSEHSVMMRDGTLVPVGPRMVQGFLDKKKNS